MYCIDLLHGISVPDIYEVNEAGVANINGGTASSASVHGRKAAWLFDRFAAAAADLALGSNVHANKAGLQIAIWEALYDGSSGSNPTSLSTGSFKATSSAGATTAASGYLDQLHAAGTTLTLKQHLVWFDAISRGQDMLTAVPEPATLAGGLVGIALALGGSRWRRRRSG